MIIKAYQLDIDTVGFIKAHRVGKHIDRFNLERDGGYGFEVREVEVDQGKVYPGEASVVITEKSIYIDNPTLTFFGSTSYFVPAFKIGRKGYYDIQNSEVFEHMDYSSSYSCRNQREAEVRQRNMALFTWLVDQL